MNGVKQVVAAGGAGRFVLDIPARSKEVVVGWRGCLRLLIFGGPAHFGIINSFAVEVAHSLTRCLDSLVQIWNGDTRQQSDDCDYDHDFDEGESALSLFFHGMVLVCGVSAATRR